MIFICYSHLDSDQVSVVTDAMKGERLNIWYDRDVIRTRTRSVSHDIMPVIQAEILRSKVFMLFLGRAKFKTDRSSILSKEMQIGIQCWKENYSNRLIVVLLQPQKNIHSLLGIENAFRAEERAEVYDFSDMSFTRSSVLRQDNDFRSFIQTARKWDEPEALTR